MESLRCMGGRGSSKWVFMSPVVRVRTGWCQAVSLPSVHLAWTLCFALWLSVPWESFWKVTQNSMAILPSVLELDLGAGGSWWLVCSGK